MLLMGRDVYIVYTQKQTSIYEITKDNSYEPLIYNHPLESILYHNPYLQKAAVHEPELSHSSYFYT